MAGETRPELTPLGDEEKRRVGDELSRRGLRCGACGSARFTVGDALYLGFLFLSERRDSYMVALTCDNPDCAVPHTGLRLPARKFLEDDQSRPA